MKSISSFLTEGYKVGGRKLTKILSGQAFYDAYSTNQKELEGCVIIEIDITDDPEKKLRDTNSAFEVSMQEDGTAFLNNKRSGAPFETWYSEQTENMYSCFAVFK